LQKIFVTNFVPWKNFLKFSNFHKFPVTNVTNMNNGNCNLCLNFQQKKKRPFMKKTLFLTLLPVLLLACSRNQTVKLPEEVERGRKIFYDSNYGSTGLACANCHADFDDEKYPDDRIRPGHNLIGVTKKKVTWYGRFRGEALGATAYGAGLCIVMYQRKDNIKNPFKALPPEDASALIAYFEFITGDAEPKINDIKPILPWESEKDRLAKLEVFKSKILSLKGNPQNGEIIYEKACQQCHSEEIAIGPPLFNIEINPGKMIELIRAGSPMESQTMMPFFTPDKLTDQDIADLISFLKR
jgi:mono/diheme cytochrome c family protein